MHKILVDAAKQTVVHLINLERGWDVMFDADAIEAIVDSIIDDTRQTPNISAGTAIMKGIKHVSAKEVHQALSIKEKGVDQVLPKAYDFINSPTRD